MMAPLDVVDRRLIGALKQDGRMRYTDLASKLGVTEGTVRNRIQRLTEQGALKVVPIIDQTKIGYRLNVWLGVRCRPGTFGRVADELARLHPIRYVGACTGTFDVIAEAIFLSESEMYAFLESDIPTIDGIISTESSMVLRMVKLGYEWELCEEEYA
jgi:Lrp/AsnC family transcriptional regulator, regulator for asnA, asnC and gidA